MAKKNKPNRKGQNPPAPAPKPAQKAEITISDVADSPTQSAFEKNREALLSSLRKEVGLLEEKRTSAQEAVEKAERDKQALEAESAGLSKEKETLQREYDAIREQYDKAVSTIESAEKSAEELLSTAAEQAERLKTEAAGEGDAIRVRAEAEARKIREAADQESMKKLIEASQEARNAWNEQIQSLKKQIDDISAREKELHDGQLKLERDRQDFALEKEELDEMKEYIQLLKNKYAGANPSKLAGLELELGEAEEKYALLLERYQEIAQRLEKSQILLDTIKTEVEDPDGGRRLASLNEIVTALGELREKHKRLEEICRRYPDDASIAQLEEKARKAEKLERANNALEQERNRYREEAVAARNAGMELEAIRQEVEATNALNEHLLQELESHKTALESRTGDTCPSLSKVDAETEAKDFVDDINRRMQKTQIGSLRELVSHVKNYAGSRTREERLFYTDNDIRAFLAGMAVSKLIILQGMSGTGKSSLPRIFAQAVSGFNRLIPVESSWRDRNELLGYYNDFNKKFNAKSFTIELYRSCKKVCREIPTFIVLDEMNLARIEYYFSDFLAILQKPDHDEWLIELVSSDMRTLPMELPEEVKQRMKLDAPSVFGIWEKIERSRQGDLRAESSDEEKELLTSYLAKLGRLTGAKDLIDGRKIKVSDNIWFVGTANRDESTFEISDKVYDRAQIVSLNKKGVPENKYTDTAQKYISVTQLQKFFDKAVDSFRGRQDTEKRFEELDLVLMENFDVSFGNRIVTQSVDFAAVFTAAGGSLTDALDYQISTKILRKVLPSDDADAFQELLEATKDYPETRRLIQKRLKDLR